MLKNIVRFRLLKHSASGGALVSLGFPTAAVRTIRYSFLHIDFLSDREEKQTKGIYRQLDANYFTHTGSQIIIYIYLHVDTLVRVVYHKIGTLKANEVH